MLYNALTGDPLGPPLEHEEPISAAVFSSDGDCLVTASGPPVMQMQHSDPVWQNRGHARLWDARRARPLSGSLSLAAPVDSISFDPNGHHFVTELYDGSSRLWSLALARPIGPPWRTAKEDRQPATWSRSLPTEADVCRLRLWIEVAIGAELDAGGTVRPLDDPEWRERRRQLLELVDGNIPDRL